MREGQPDQALDPTACCGAECRRVSRIFQPVVLERENRRRTPGGVFFHLARNRMTTQQRGKLFGGPQQGAQAAPLFQVEDLPEVLQALTQHYGKATTVKLTVIGRPTQVVERGDVVIFGLLSDKQPALPKGLPVPPKETKYLVLVAKKQWNKVAGVVKDAEVC